MDQVSDSELLEFIDNSGNRALVDAAFADLRARGLLPEMLARLDEAAVGQRLPIAHAPALVPAIFDVAESFKNEMGFGKQMPFIAAWRTVSWFLKREPDPERRGEFFLHALRVSYGLAVPAMLISLEDDRRDNQQETDFTLLSDAQHQEAKDIWTQKVSNLFRRDPESVLRNEHFGQLLFNWQRWEGGDVGRQWLTEIITQDRMLVKVLQAFTSEGQSQGLGDYVAGRHAVFQLEALQQFTETAPLVARVENIMIDLDQTEREACNRFLEAIRRQPQERAAADRPPQDPDPEDG
jgi:hypothetical protein